MSASEDASLTLLQITDLHLRAAAGDTLLGVDTWHSLAAVLDQALDQHCPHALLITGDVAHDPDAHVYERLRGWLDERFTGPLLVLPGNHDVKERMGSLATTRVLELGSWTVVGLDSHQDEVPEALVSPREFESLRDACGGARGEHVLVATHHPPVSVGCPWLDKDRIQNADELLEWMAEHGSVRAMVFGHAHQELSFSDHRLLLLGTPSTCIQFAPRSERFAVDDLKPGYRWLELGGDGSVRTSVGRVADYPLHIDRSQFKPA